MEVTPLLLFALAIFVLHQDCCSSCEINLVTGPHGVTNESITASSYYPNPASRCWPSSVRTDSGSAWCAASKDAHPYIQVKFRALSVLKSIVTLGRSNHPYQYVTRYVVETSMDGIAWRSLTDQTGNIKVFEGNTAERTPKENILDENVVARYIRIAPKGYNDHPSMRLEVKGSCSKANVWKAKLGTVQDVVSVLMDTTAENQGYCGKRCHRNPSCESFLFDTSTRLCQLFQTNVGVSHFTANLTGRWFFVKIDL